MTDIRRMPAEWEESDFVLLAFPDSETDWAYMLPEVTECYRQLLSELTDAGIKTVLLCRYPKVAEKALGESLASKIRLVAYPINDTWTRDYGPITVEEKGRPLALDFGFNGWGLKFAADRDNLANLHLRDISVIPETAYRNNRDYVLEGGSIESDGQGVILTTSRCLCSPNRNGGLTKAQVEKQLAERLGANHVLWLDNGALEGDDTDSHIDTLARICPEETILYVGCSDKSDSHFEELDLMYQQLRTLRTPDGLPYNLVELPLPNPIYDKDGNRLPATYANYLIANGHIFVPVYGQELKDRLAVMTIMSVFPNHKIHTVDCNALIRQHGSLHCATMQVPKLQ